MSESQKATPSKPDNKSNFFKSPAHLLLLIVIFIILIILAAYIKQNNKSEPSAHVTTTNSSEPNLSLTSNDLNPMSDGTVKVSVWEDSQDQSVNAVQTTLTYPADKFDYVDSDNSASAFEVEAQNSSDSGKIVIVRGHKGNLSGRQLVSVVSLKAKSSPGTASLAFDGDSHLISSATNEDILVQSSGINFNIGN